MKESRLFKIIYYILEKGSMTASELADKLEVSVRTIYRDIDRISSSGIPIYMTPGRKGGIQLLDHYILNQTIFSDKEKQDILATLQSAALVNPSLEKELLTKLAALFHIELEDWFEIDFSRWNNHSQDTLYFEQLKNAIITHKAIVIDYINSCGIKSTRKIYPLKLFFKSKEWYMKAYCTVKADFRLFKLTRITHVELLEERFKPINYPKAEIDVDITVHQVILCFAKKVAYRIYDEFTIDDIEEQSNGDLIVSTKMPEGDWLTSYLLSFGASVKVIEPLYLKEILAQEAQLIYNHYKT